MQIFLPLQWQEDSQFTISTQFICQKAAIIHNSKTILRLGLALLKINWSHLDLPVAPLKIYLPDCDAPDICYLHLVSGVDGKVDGGAVGDPHLGHPCPVLVQDRPLHNG